MKVHIPGSGDFTMKDVTAIDDPCPFPNKVKRTLNEKERIIYAPMSDVGNIFFDKDAIYINMPSKNNKSNKKNKNGEDNESDVEVQEEEDELQVDEENNLVKSLQSTKFTIDEKLQNSGVQLFKNSNTILRDSDNDDYDNEDYDDDDDVDGLNEDDFIDDDDDDDDNDDGEEDDENDNNKIIQNKREEGRRRVPSEMVADKKRTRKEEYQFEDEDEEEQEQNYKWKNNMIKMANHQYTKSINFVDIIYGVNNNNNIVNETQENYEEDDELFIVKKTNRNDIDATDTCKFIANEQQLPIVNIQVEDENTTQDNSIDDELLARFVDQGETGYLGNGGDDKEVLYGDFEDLETNEIHKAVGEDIDNKNTNNNNSKDKKSNYDNKEERNKKKEELKKAFDKEYDAEMDENSADYFSELKQELNEQNQKLKTEFANEEEEYRTKYEGIRVGSYVRIEIDKVPYELIKHFNPNVPIIIGGLLPNEEQLGFVQIRLKKHRWHKKILKSNDPLIFSIGWRRFQTIPIYSVEDKNDRNRMLKYTPEHMHCIATFYGPITPPNTGVIAFQYLSNNSVC